MQKGDAKTPTEDSKEFTVTYKVGGLIKTRERIGEITLIRRGSFTDMVDISAMDLITGEIFTTRVPTTR